MPTPRGIWMDGATRDGLREYAWLKRTSMGAVLRAAIEDVRDNPSDDSVLSDDDSRSDVRVNVKIEDAAWEGALESSARIGRSLNSLVRRRVRKTLKEEGLLQ